MSNFFQNLQLKIFAYSKIPLIYYSNPKIIHLDSNRCEVVIPLTRRTRNHVKSLYFGALSIGADLGAGLFVMEAIKKSGKKVNFIFKDFKADFLKLALSDTHFHCNEGEKVAQAVAETIMTKKRVNSTIHMWATTPAVTGDEPIAKFTLTISVKVKE